MTTGSESPDNLRPPADGGFLSNFDFEYVEASGERLVARWVITPAQHQNFGIVHGGVYAAVVEQMASLGALIWLDGKGRPVGVNNNTDFLRAVSEGVLTAEATPLHRGRLQQLWQVVISDEQGRTIARGQVRIQNLPL